MATCVSALTSLTKLSIGFESPASRPNPTNRRPPPLTRAVLPTLTNFKFRGVTQIDAPLLHRVEISFFNQLVFDIQQLTRFIGYAPALISAGVTFSPRRRPSIGESESLSFDISCEHVDWQVSSVAQICNQLSFVLSSIDQLSIIGMDDIQWLELFQPFTAVRTLRIFNKIPSPVLSGLQGLSGGSATQVLPALEELQLSWYQASYHDNLPFIVARQRSDHPVVVRELSE
ncbi:hypothetical protein BGW80DRAFT_1446339 [Lactifluus volemus]|nr:hypothetical protein BGW80DRAFT_1446339 [Lactifluus volemus]